MPESMHSIRRVDSVIVAEEHNKHIIQAPTFTWPVIRHYFATRISSLWVGKEELSQHSWNEILNPFQPLVHVNLHQWNFFFIGFLAWTWDAFDFFTTSLNVSNIAREFDVTVTEVSWGMTIVLMLRTVGALVFGAMGDLKGRKWPYIINLLLLVVIQCGTGFVQTFQQFLVTRALFGIAMGGLYGISCAEALSDAPVAARGVLSGLFQEGYAMGFLLAIVFQRAITDTTPHGWRSLFWFSAGPPVVLIIWRFFTPETDTFQHIAAKRAVDDQKQSRFANFKFDAKNAIKDYWLIIIYLVFMMSGFNFSSHGSQDLYATLLEQQYFFGADKRTVVLVCAKLGALTGGIIIGHASTIIGRRTAILFANLWCLSFIYLWAYKPLWITAFMLQFGVQGAWAVVPIHLSELSPPQFRAFVMGVSYQLGNLVSSASATIESTLSEKFLLPDGSHDYSKSMSIFVAVLVAYLFFVVLLGPENRNADLGIEREEFFAVFDDKDELTKRSFDHVEDEDKQKSASEKV